MASRPPSKRRGVYGEGGPGERWRGAINFYNQIKRCRGRQTLTERQKQINQRKYIGALILMEGRGIYQSSLALVSLRKHNLREREIVISIVP